MRNKQIDGLRGVAIILIVVFHIFCRYNQLFLDSNIYFLNHFGRFGVCIFLIISAYFLKCDNNQNIKKTILKFLRIYPSYLLAIIIIIILLLIFPLKTRFTILPKSVLLNIFMINGYVDIPYIDSAHWYLRALTIFILLNFILTKLKKETLRMTAIYIIMVLIVFIKLLYGKCPAIIFGGKFYCFYLIGISLYHILNKREIKWLPCTIIAIMAVYILYDINHIIYISIILPIFVLVVKNKISILEKQPFSFLGSISYPLYLIHQNISYIIIYYISTKTACHEITSKFIALIVVILIATTMYYLYEKPIQKKLNTIN